MTKYPGGNLTEDGMRAYLDTFHRTYRETAEAHLSPDELGRLERYPLLSGRIVGYVSTQYGAAFEYVGGSVSEITIKRHSSRIDDFFLNAPPFVRNAGVTGFNLTNSSEIRFTRIGVNNARPFRIQGEDSSLLLEDCEFRFGSWHRKILLAEIYGNRTADFWSESSAIRRAKDEILVALSDVATAAKRGLTLGESLKRFKERTVLVLGDYGEPGMQRIASIREALMDNGYEVILVKDVPDLPGQDLQQKAVALGSVARFVVVDDSSRSGHLVELARAQENRWVTIIVRQLGSEGSYMTHAASATSSVIYEADYDQSSLAIVLREAIAWSEQRISDLNRTYGREYPWRSSQEVTDITSPPSSREVTPS